MFRSKAFRIFFHEHSFSSLFWKNNPKLYYKNTWQGVTTADFSVKTKENVLTSNVQPDPGLEINEKFKKLSEKEFLVRLKTDPDRFGSQIEPEYFDEGDLEEEKYFTEQPLPSQKLRTKQYADIIKALIAQRKIKEAIDVVEVRMLKEDRVKPEAYIYNLLLGACGRVGYTKKAFMLYNDMKKRGLKVMGGTYTALFNACSNSPWPLTDGLTRAKHLREIMIEKGHKPNNTTYNAMIKAFGRCGDLSTAFFLTDEMISKGIPLTNDTINFLLQACVSDTDAGFRHALLVWRKVIDKNLKPNIYVYNTFLRTIRDCGMGDIETTMDVIKKIVSPKDVAFLSLISEQTRLTSDTDSSETASSNVAKENSQIKVSDSASVDNVSNISDGIENLQTDVEVIPEDSGDILRPNLLAKVPHLGSLISLSEVKKPEDRLLLVGGFKGFLENMKEYHCKPDIKTFTLLLDCMPGSLMAEQELLSVLKKHNVQPDVDFYNMIMKKRSMRSDYEGAKVVLEMMRQLRYKPNVMTYGLLAMGCKTKEQSIELIEEMKSKKYNLNVEIIGAMLHQACHNNDIDYVLHCMELCLTENVNPSEKFIKKLNDLKQKCRGLYIEKTITDKQKKLFKIFRERNKTWRKQVHVDDSEGAHPWQQYRQTTEGEYKPNILKDTARFKARRASLFRVKTSTKVRY